MLTISFTALYFTNWCDNEYECDTSIYKFNIIKLVVKC